MIQSSVISKLRKIAKEREPVKETSVERCFFCGRALPEEHRHLVSQPNKKFVCACEMCIVTMADTADYKPLPQRFLELDKLLFSDELWSDFLIPVNMAFLVKSSSHEGTVAYYPSAAGATESKLKMDPWERLAALNPSLNEMAIDLEALLINRLSEPPQYFIVPVDSCYELIGRIRLAWKGIFGGKEVNDTIQEFFKKLKHRSTHAGFAI